ncbi:MAG TPA: MMPL family transporter [Acidimicrobiales bacterium]|nr:MMPL family transporter [Acidimicrobiales bacterium]
MATFTPIPLAEEPLTDPARTHADGWLAGLGRFAVRRRRGVLLVWLLLTASAAPLAATLTPALSGAGWDPQGTVAASVRAELRRDFPQVGAEAAVVVYRQVGPIRDDATGMRAVLDALAGTGPVVDPLSAPADAGLVAADGRTALVPVVLSGASDADLPDAAHDLIEAVDRVILPPGARAEVTGEWPVWSDFNASNEEALHKAELLSGLPTIVLLVVAFGSAVAAGLPLVLAVAGIAVAFATLHLLTGLTALSVWSMNFSMMIGLAVGIDYSLFIVSRYREEREDGWDTSAAMANTLATAGKAVFLSALTVVLSLAAVLIVPIMVFRSMALGMILAVVATAVASLTLLPAALAALGDRVLVARGHADPDRAAMGRWQRWTGWALRRPGRALAAGLILLLVLAAPAAGMRLGMPGARVVDEGRSSRDGYELLVGSFGPGAAAPLFVTVPAEDAPRVIDVARADPGVVDARVVAEPAASGRTVVRVTPSTAVDDQATSDLVARMRDRLATVPDVLVGGPAAQNHDLTGLLTGRAPLAIGLIMVVAFLLLLVVFRSLPIAIASIALNLVSVAASFGFATLVFQHGIGASLIGIEHQGFVDAWAPLFFFALLFGLSMDYQLFLLAGIRERYEETGDAHAAVRDGTARTGRPITNAALVMIVVFIAFGVTGPIPPTELGVTLALAVLLDATVVRMLLVPALLGRLGDRAWWLPDWLDRLLPVVKFDH